MRKTTLEDTDCPVELTREELTDIFADPSRPCITAEAWPF